MAKRTGTAPGALKVAIPVAGRVKGAGDGQHGVPGGGAAVRGGAKPATVVRGGRTAGAKRATGGHAPRVAPAPRANQGGLDKKLDVDACWRDRR